MVVVRTQVDMLVTVLAAMRNSQWHELQEQRCNGCGPSPATRHMCFRVGFKYGYEDRRISGRAQRLGGQERKGDAVEEQLLGMTAATMIARMQTQVYGQERTRRHTTGYYETDETSAVRVFIVAGSTRKFPELVMSQQSKFLSA